MVESKEDEDPPLSPGPVMQSLGPPGYFKDLPVVAANLCETAGSRKASSAGWILQGGRCDFHEETEGMFPSVMVADVSAWAWAWACSAMRLRVVASAVLLATCGSGCWLSALCFCLCVTCCRCLL